MKNKNQNQDQRKQAAHAVTIFFEIRRPPEKEDGVKKETRKNKDLQPQKTTEKLLRNEDWVSGSIRTIQELLGHNDVRTTMIYTHTIKSQIIQETDNPLDFWFFLYLQLDTKT